MRLGTLGCPLAAGLAIAGPALGDWVKGTRSNSLYERRHEVYASMHRGWAELRVRRTVENLGVRHDQALLWLDLPPGAVAVGLRTLGAVAGRPTWFSGELMEAEAAAAKYRELTGIGGYYPKDPALLSWRSSSTLALQVFPVAPNDRKTIEYTLLVPTVYERGAYRYSLPALGTKDLIAEVSWAGVARDEKLMVDGSPAAPGGHVTPAAGGSVELALVPKVSGPLEGELALVPATKSKVFARFSIQAAPRVSEVPRGAYVVVVLDSSRSLSLDDLAGEQVAAKAYLRHFKDAQVEIITFDRKARRRYDRFVPVEQARRDLGARSIAQKNGSAVDDALAEAEHALAQTPAGHPRRVLLLSDARTRQSLKPERLRAIVGTSGAVVHLVELRAGAAELRRDDTHKWAEAARATGGLAWWARAAARGADAATRVFEEWARPMRIDHLKLFSPDIELFGGGEAPPEVLDEGEGVTRALWGTRSVSWVRVEGELWSKHVEHVVHPSAHASKRWSALIFGDDAATANLNDAEMMTLALRGGAVSPVTSYLATEPGVRPSTEGLEHGETAGFVRAAGASSLRMSASSVAGKAPAFDRDRWLRDALRPTWLACGGKADSATVTFETTLAEVVDVAAPKISTGHDAALERCLSEAVWDLVLPPQFDEDWASWSVSI